MEGDECNLLDAVATMLGLRGLVVSSSFFFFSEKFAFVFFYFSFYVSCWFKWINPLIFCR